MCQTFRHSYAPSRSCYRSLSSSARGNPCSNFNAQFSSYGQPPTIPIRACRPISSVPFEVTTRITSSSLSRSRFTGLGSSTSFTEYPQISSALRYSDQYVWQRNSSELSPLEEHFTSPWSEQSPQNTKTDQDTLMDPVIDSSSDDMITVEDQLSFKWNVHFSGSSTQSAFSYEVVSRAIDAWVLEVDGSQRISQLKSHYQSDTVEKNADLPSLLLQESHFSQLITSIQGNLVLKSHALPGPASMSNLLPATETNLPQPERQLQSYLIPHEAPFVSTSSSLVALKSLSGHISARFPVLLSGPPSSGKNTIIQKLACHLWSTNLWSTKPTGDQSIIDQTEFDRNVVILNLASRTLDAKSLVGSYVSSTKDPRKFVFVEGPLLRAMKEGKWLVCQDIDRASDYEIGGGYGGHGGPNGVGIDLGAQAGWVSANERFLLLATRTCQHERAKSFVGEQYWKEVVISSMTKDDILNVVTRQTPSFSQDVRDRLVSAWEENQPLSSVSQNPVLQEQIFLEGVDLFLASSENLLVEIDDSTSSEDLRAAQALGRHLELNSERSAYCVCCCIPDFIPPTQKHRTGSSGKGKTYATIGRVKQQINTAIMTSAKSDSRPFALTKSTLVLLERLTVCMRSSEPTLLVGETGTGKTTVVSYMAKLIGKKLISLNLSNQSEASDLLGGFKPLDSAEDGKLHGNRLVDDFINTSGDAFNTSRNHEFVHAIRKAASKKKYIRLVALLKDGIRALSERLNNKTKSDDQQLPADSDDCHEPSKRCKTNISRNKTHESSQARLKISLQDYLYQVNQFEDKFVRSTSNHMRFRFVEGPLFKALQNGDWVLLDEINLGTTETLEALSGLLRHPNASVTLSERGDLVPVTRHPDFRLIGCMNPATGVGKRGLPGPSCLRSQGSSPLSAQFSACELSLRDGLAWCDFIKSCSSLSPPLSFIHGAQMTVLDRLGTAGFEQDLPPHLIQGLRASCLDYCYKVAGISHESDEDLIKIAYLPDGLKIGDFMLAKSTSMIVESAPASYSFSAQTVAHNAMRIIRALQVPKAVLLEGSPGVGKTSIVEALARLSGKRLQRINLSDQTDLLDLFGADAPVEGGSPGQFEWKDASFLDVVFAAQNPHHQGGSRKGLPRSLVDRITVVFMTEMEKEDLLQICTEMAPSFDQSAISQMVPNAVGSSHLFKYLHPILQELPSELVVGHSRLVKPSGSSWTPPVVSPLELPPSLFNSAEALIRCLELKWLPILTGTERSGKSSLAKYLASRKGVQLRVISLHSGTDTSDLIGGFEQSNMELKLIAIIEDVCQIIQINLDDLSLCRDASTHNLEISCRDLNYVKNLVFSFKTDKLVSCALQIMKRLGNHQHGPQFNTFESSLLELQADPAPLSSSHDPQDPVMRWTANALIHSPSEYPLLTRTLDHFSDPSSADHSLKLLLHRILQPDILSVVTSWSHYNRANHFFIGKSHVSKSITSEPSVKNSHQIDRQRFSSFVGLASDAILQACLLILSVAHSGDGISTAELSDYQKLFECIRDIQEGTMQLIHLSELPPDHAAIGFASKIIDDSINRAPTQWTSSFESTKMSLQPLRDSHDISRWEGLVLLWNLCCPPWYKDLHLVALVAQLETLCETNWSLLDNDLRAIYYEIVASLKITQEISTQCPDITWLTEKLKEQISAAKAENSGSM
ncbi:hypothetical protein PSTT_12279 [Puccinia striiformis]|uniref:AAA+ ATPase domain-containing protein n=1 Tax=Puccinia striiformis TaxID=27350 RepID=A0A2S4UWV3_9BASI|nr:hypothetical protein PSTT_12279 [Puccinia striiformis]